MHQYWSVASGIGDSWSRGKNSFMCRIFFCFYYFLYNQNRTKVNLFKVSILHLFFDSKWEIIFFNSTLLIICFLSGSSLPLKISIHSSMKTVIKFRGLNLWKSLHLSREKDHRRVQSQLAHAKLNQTRVLILTNKKRWSTNGVCQAFRIIIKILNYIL